MSGTITFPPNPTDGQLYTANNTTWQWHANPGVWVNANTGANFLPLSGGTLTGELVVNASTAPAGLAVIGGAANSGDVAINKPQPQLYLNAPAAGQARNIISQTAGSNRWTVNAGDNTAESGSNAGSNFQIARWSDAGAFLDSPIQISRQTGVVTMPNAVSEPALNNVGRNLIHNALYAVQQRGTGPWTTNVYTADRWKADFTGDTVSFSVITLADADRSQIGDEAARYAMQNVFTGAASSSYDRLMQPMETVRRTSGKTLVLSLWAKASAGTPRLALTFDQNFGTGGSPSAVVPVGVGVTTALTASWVRYSFTVAVPSASGKTLGTNGDDNLRLHIWYSDSAGFTGTSIGQQSGTVQIWGVQLEIAQPGQTQPTSLEKKEYADDLRLCQRFFQIVWASDRGPASAANQQFATTVSWPLMRALPTAAVSVAGNNSLATGAALTVSGTNGGRFGFASTGAGDCFVLDQAYSLSADL